MICVISLIVFAFLGLFSARYRNLAKEAFECVFKRIQLKPCESGLDQRVKSKIIGKVFKRNKKAAGFLNKYFEVFSWLLVILMFVSLGFTANGLYNYFAYGNCNGPNADPGSCVLPSGNTGQNLDFQKIELSQLNYSDNPILGPEGAKITIYEFGCFECPYTYSIQSELDKLMREYKEDIQLVFMHFPISEHHNSHFLAKASICAQRQGKFWRYKNKLFTIQGTCTVNGENNVREKATKYAREIGLNMEEFNSCVDQAKVNQEITNDKKQGLGLGVDKTPTLFIDGEKVAGFKTYQELKKIVEDKLEE